MRSNALRASDAGLLLLAATLPAAVLATVRLLPPADLADAGLGWADASLAAGLIAVAAAGALVCLVTGLRRGALAALFGAGAAAAVAGGAVGHLAGAPSMAASLLAGAGLLLAAAVADRVDALVRGHASRIGIAAAMLLLAEAAALVHVIPATAELAAPHETTLLIMAGAVSVAASLAGAGRGFGLVGIAAAFGIVGVLIDRGNGIELVIGLVGLTAAQLAGIRMVSERRELVPSHDDGEHLPSLASHLSEAVMHFDGHLQLREWNGSAELLLGLDEGSIGSRLEDLLGLTMAELPAPGAPSSAATVVGGLDIRMGRAGDGLTAVVRDVAAMADGERLGRELRGTIEELLEARRTIDLQRAELERSATIDLLTGVSSRGAILDRLQVEIAQARRYQHPVAVVLLDIDGFAELNHRIGVSGGDALLREVALRMRLRVREADAIGRAGSDGFLAVLPHTDEGGAATFAGALRHRLGQRPVLIGDELVSLTVSVGVAVMRPGEDLDLDGLLARVGEALDSARGAGGDRIALDRLHGLARLDDRDRDTLADGSKAQDSGA